MADPWDNDPIVRPRTAAQPQQASAQNAWDSDPVVGQQSQSAPRAAARQAARPQVRFSDDRDALIRTVIGEAQAEPPEGQAAVAAVILNRARQRGMTPSQVVLEANQFEPWGNPQTASRLSGISPSDPLYQAAAAQVDRALGGYDPTGGADHFYAPIAQQALGRNAPSWAVGEPTIIGGHNFYSLGGSTEDARMVAAEGAATPVEVVDQFSEPEAQAPAVGTRENPIDLTDRNQAILAKKGDWVRLENGDLTRAAADAVEGAKGDQQGSGAYAYTPSAIDAVGAGALAASEQIPFLDESVAFTTGLATGEGYDAMRARQQALAQVDNQAQRGARVAGGVTGFATGLLAPGAGYIGRGANAAQMAGRAAQVGAIGGGIYGAGAADDSYASRLSGLGQGAVIGAATGGLFQMGANRLAGAPRQNVGRARQLSREGVNLTPAQMLSDVPLVGGIAQMGEDIASGYIPFIQGARNRATEDFQIATLNRALGEIGQSLPRPSRTFGRGETGYEAINQARAIFNEAYEGIIPRLRIVGDDALGDDLAAVVSRAEDELIDDGARGQVARLLGSGVIGRMRNEGADAVLDNTEFARVDRRLRNVVDNIRSNPNSNPDQVVYADIVDDARTAVREALARQNPEVSDDLLSINRGYAQYKLAERAASGSAPIGREGVATPGEFSQAVATNATRGQSGTGRGLGQDLARAGRGVLPAKIGDTGSGQRAVVGAIAAGGLTVAPAIAAPVIAASIAYSRPMQSVLNAIYRAPDSPQVRRHLARAASLAQREPALQPYYQEAVRFVTQQEPLRQQQPASRNQAPRQRQAG